MDVLTLVLKLVLLSHLLIKIKAAWHIPVLPLVATASRHKNVGQSTQVSEPVLSEVLSLLLRNLSVEFAQGKWKKLSSLYNTLVL